MSKAPTNVDLPKVTPADVHRFEQAAQIKDRKAFAAELDAFIREKVALMEERVTGDSAELAESLVANARSLRARTRWVPSDTELQRGRSEMLKVFDQRQNLPLAAFAELAHKSRQQIYKDLATNPPRLLALNVGRRGQKLPEWQLDPLRLRLTQRILEKAKDVDAWTIFKALSEPMDALAGKSPIEAVRTTNLNSIAEMVCDTLGLH